MDLRAADEYVDLALRIDRLAPGSVDAYTGDPATRNAIGREPMPTPASLVRQAGALVRRLPDAGLDPARERFLAAQLAALDCTARRLVGQHVPFLREVEACFDVRVELGSEDRYRDAHRELARLLPGSASLAQRLADHRRRDAIAPGRLAAALVAMSDALRARIPDAYRLPTGESVTYRVVRDAPWSALSRYRGRYRTAVDVNAAARVRRSQLAGVVAHEAYPGHHTDHCRKESGLVVERGWREHEVFLVNTPQALVAEGVAEVGLHALVGTGWGRWAAAVLSDVGLGFDGDLAEQVARAWAGLARVRSDAAVLLHDRHAPTEDVVAHLRRWLLVDDARARLMLGFLAHPLWRAYAVTYVEGAALVRTWLDRAGPDAAVDRFRMLLDEPMTPSELRNGL